MTSLSPDLKLAILEAGGVPLVLTDPQTNENYVLVKADTYEKLSGLVVEGDLTDEEKLGAPGGVGAKGRLGQPRHGRLRQLRHAPSMNVSRGEVGSLAPPHATTIVESSKCERISSTSGSQSETILRESKPSNCISQRK